MSISVFLSTVSDEFRAYREQLLHDLTRPDVSVKVQEDFKDLGGGTLDKLDVYIAYCDAVVHLIGDMTGAMADERQQQALLAKHPDFAQRLPPFGEALNCGVAVAYTQWEAWLALYHGKVLLIAQAAAVAPRGPNFKSTDESRAAQAAHLERLKAFNRYPGCEFQNPDDLAKDIAYSAILDLLVKNYAEEAARERDVGEGFIREMAKRVAGDQALDFDGMKKAVENAIDIYENEIAGRPVETNLDDVVGRALKSAKDQVDKGQSRLARATLRSAAAAMRREEQERRERFAEGQTQLYNRERDIALASYDGEAAAEATMALADAIHGNDKAAIATFLGSEAKTLDDYGRDRGSNVHLVAVIMLRKRLLALAESDEERCAAHDDLGDALRELGEREGATARLEEAVQVYRAALEENTRERDPHRWAATQNNLGIVLAILGERESGTAGLEEAAKAYRGALEECSRERSPFDWAAAQMNLANVVRDLGERGNGTAELEEAVAAYRSVLEVRTRERVPLDWAMTQNNLGNALATLGARESDTARLEEAIAAFRAALEERTRERVPLDWAMTQNNLGNALQTLGQRESGTARLEEAVAAYRASLGGSRRELVPLQWAITQMNLGNALAILARRQNEASLLEGALACMRSAADAYQQAGKNFWLPIAQRRIAEIEADLAAMKDRARDGG